MGGRGTNSRVSGIPKNKRKSIESYKKRIDEHYDKIKQAKKTGQNIRAVHHWEAEIKAWKDKIEKIERRYRK